MKKKTTSVFKSDKGETDNTELHISTNNNQKTYRDHKSSDYYAHSRANKFPFGSNNGPACF